MAAYYNEIDPYAAQWLRNLIGKGLIAPGDVDERSIVDVRADDLRGYTQCHFFAGIGGWSLALRLAGCPDGRPVWTGSCPCQPFSAAGKGKAADDERHLWPRWFPLIAERRPATVFGEQVEAAIGWGWLDLVCADLEGEGYACGAAVLPACGVGGPHIRQRLWFVADTDGGDPSAAGLQRSGQQRQQPQDGGAGELGNAIGPRLQEQRGQRGISPEQGGAEPRQAAFGAGAPTGGMADSAHDGWREERADHGRFGARDRAERIAAGLEPSGHVGGMAESASEGRGAQPQRTTGTHWRTAAEPGRLRDTCGPLNGFWSDAEWIACTDRKARPVGPGSFPLGHGIPNRASKLRAYGNAIVPQVAAEFIMASAP